MGLSLEDRICHGQQFHDHVTEDPDLCSVSEGDIVGLKAISGGRNVTWRTVFFFSQSFFLLGACKRMKRMKEKKQKGTFEKSLKVLSSKSCNFWVRVGSSFTVMGHKVLCAL